MNDIRPTIRRLPDGLVPSAGSVREEDPPPMSYVLGIDVGAARTSAAVAREGSDDVEAVDLGDGGCGVTSVLHLGADGSLDVGAAAERWADDEPDRVVRGFPGRIGDDVPMVLAGEPWAPEELTAWLVRWVVDRVAEREGAAAAGVAVTRPASWDDDRTELLAGALAEQDLDVTFLTTARAAEWHSGATAADDSAQVASDAACGAALALLAGDVEAERTDDVASRVAALAQFPGMSVEPASNSDGDDDPPAEVPSPRSHHSGAWSNGGLASFERRTEKSGAHAAGERRIDDSGAHAADERRIEGSGAHAAADQGEPEPDDSGSDRPEKPQTGDDTGAPSDDDGLFTALGGFSGTFGATNTAGLLSGYTPPSGLPLSATESQATALVTETDEPVMLPTQRSGSGRWAAVADAAEDYAEEYASEAAPAAAVRRGRSPAALVSIGGAAAAVAVIATLFLWPAPRTTNSAVSRPAPLVPAFIAPALPTVELTPTPTLTPTTHRPRPAPTRTRRAAAPVPPPVVETTPAPSESVEPSPTGTTSAPPSESTTPPTTPTTTKKKDED
ncbi:Hsp70 family protein [Pseudonocardia charpentierae]|uniref:Hsp70 protein n=1 Tax=Pseudonocardia charpentierae TaxID=3075545 RepID=A0ABU2NBI8_9PSEU|nr:hypothetical protein [Pseudonocardia sp. DSM 45834]MDT0351229.1 hypothetical protein [Pseudonocardia sp. DSM 45834]